MNRAAKLAVMMLTGIVLLNRQAVGQVAAGTPPFESLGGGPFDVVNLGNLNVHFDIPILSKAGRGIPFVYNLGYDTSLWTAVSVSGTVTWQPAFNWGWESSYVANAGQITFKRTVGTCHNGDGENGSYSNTAGYVYHDSHGVSHSFTGGTFYMTGSCGDTNIPSFTSTATDGSGLTLYGTGSLLTSTITTAGGSTLLPGQNLANGSTAAAVVAKDTNGNQVTSNTSGVFTDTLGKSALTVAGTAPSPVTLQYTAPAGSAQYTINYTTYNIKTAFNCTGVSEDTVSSIPLVTSIMLPDTSQYTFTYEDTPGYPTYKTGRLTSVTLPTGGTITYAYNTADGHDGIICADGSTDGLTRTVNPAIANPSGVWTYARSGSGSSWTTTVTDPGGNQTAINFAKDSAVTNPTYNFYETQRQTYQGTTSGTLLLTTLRCYNGNTTGCATASVASPITQTAVALQYPGSSGQQSKTVTSYNSYGLVTQVDQYAFGSGSPGGLLRSTQTSYATTLGAIVDRPANISVYDLSSNLLAKTTFGYDESSPTATSGVPNHVAVSSSRGNVTTATSYSSSSASLAKHFSYYDTGEVYQSQDVNGAYTTYAYGTSSTCAAHTFPTQVTLPITGLSTSTTWDCNGGAALSATDANSQTASLNYTDPAYWQPVSSSDPLGNATYYAFGPNSAFPTITYSSAAMYFNSGNSIAATVQYKDGFGRVYDNQRSQSPTSSSLDTVSYTFDSSGRPYSTSMPCAQGYTGMCSTPQTTQTYDALNRPLQSTDGGSGYVKYTYSQNDVLQEKGPAVSGVLVKKQMEYDALGRLVSVCEITAGTTSWPNGTCSQNTSANGYWTTYAYDFSSGYNRVIVKQNVQSATYQTRTFLYDLLGRLVQETNPESGTTTYIYDSSGSSSCNGGTMISSGDLVRKTDANGHNTCFYYDQIHRLTDVGPDQPSVTPCKRYKYDNSTGVLGSRPSGVTVGNGMGRLVEAETDNCAWPITSSTIATDEWFSYSARGEVTDTWESTLHSGGYKHVSATYWAHGAMQTLSIPGTPTFYYGASGGSGLDGEGRVTKVTASTGQNPVTGVNYVSSGTTQPIGSLTQVTFGSGDLDNFSYDTNTGRMTQYQGKVSSLSDTGTLSWNSNGSLASLGIVDQTNSSDTQTCNYTHDDLGRIASVNCGSAIWSQSFSFDPFGNVVKSGSLNWACATCYTASSNHYNSSLSGVISYDSDGNLLNDTFHIYTWDAYGNPATVDSTSLTYDALGRNVEINNSQQLLYLGSSAKPVAMETSSGLTWAWIALPGGAVAVYNSSGLAQYNHSDWLGSARLLTSSTQTLIASKGYAPYGEHYASSAPSGDQFTSFGWGMTVSDLYDFTFRRFHPSQGRWISPDPAGLGAVDFTNPQSWNRYAYVINNPLAFIDPLGMDCPPGSESTCIDVVATDPGGPIPTNVCAGVSIDGVDQGFTTCDGGKLHPKLPPFGLLGRINFKLLLRNMKAANSDINKTWSKTFPCNKSAPQVMSAVQNDMGQFADNRNTLFAANFPNQPLTMGGQYAIQPGLNPHSGDGSILPTGTLVVTVTSQSANGWTFTTDPSQHYIDGTVSFSSTNAGNGNITFSITANGNYSNLFWAAFGPVIKAGENSTWSNMLGSVQGYCGSPIGQ